MKESIQHSVWPRALAWSALIWVSGASAMGQTAPPVDTHPSWYDAILRLDSLLTTAAPFAHMDDPLDYFSRAFTAIGYATVMIAAIRRVAKARTGEESMGWVASMVMTVALMATGPALGNQVYSACDELAAHSGYSGPDAITTSANSLLVILPPSSPLEDVIEHAAADHSAPPSSSPSDRHDAPWTKLAWSWMKMAWASMTDALAQIGTAMHAVLNKFCIMVLLIVPAAALLLGMLGIELGLMAREILHHVMDVFLPMMIAMLSFAPMRGPATHFVTKYLTVALWPVAWVLGNAVALSILNSVMGWVTTTCDSALHVLSDAPAAAWVPPPIGPPTAGYLFAAAAVLPWGISISIVVVLTFSSLLVVASALGAPAAMTSMLTRGVCFASDQLGQAVQWLKSAPGQVAPPAPAMLSPQSASVVRVRALASGWVERAGTSLNRAALGLSGAAPVAGPMGIAAAGAVKLLSGAADVAMRVGTSAAATTEIAASDVGRSPAAPAHLSMKESPAVTSVGPSRAGGALSPRLFRRT